VAAALTARSQLAENDELRANFHQFFTAKPSTLGWQLLAKSRTWHPFRDKICGWSQAGESKQTGDISAAYVQAKSFDN
jgi:hypothetical protein